MANSVMQLMILLTSACWLINNYGLDDGWLNEEPALYTYCTATLLFVQLNNLLFLSVRVRGVRVVGAIIYISKKR